MADYCNQCATELFLDTQDLAGYVTAAQFDAGLAARAYCEGCGQTIVNSFGDCISKDCEKAHGDY